MKKKCICIVSAFLMLALLVINGITANVDKNSVYTERKLSGPVFYAVMLALSVAILVYYIVFAKRLHIWALLSFAFVCIANTGYLALSLSSSLSEALLANRISYFGNVYMLLFLIISLSNANGIRFSRAAIGLMFSFSSVMFLLAATQGYLDIFYKNVDFAIVDGYARILKDYGPMHTAYFYYILLCFALIVGTTVYAIRKKKTFSLSYSVTISWIVLVNVTIWVVEQFIPHTVEFLSLSYVLNAAFLLWIYNQLVKEGALDSYIVTMKIRTGDEAEKTLDIVMENRNSDEVLTHEGSLDPDRLSPEELRELIRKLPAENSLTERETEVAVLLLKNLKRKEMAASLCVSEDTIKTHTAHIYGKLNVTSRRALREKADEIIRKL